MSYAAIISSKTSFTDSRLKLAGGNYVVTMATIPEVSLNAIERKNLLKLADQLYSSTHCKLVCQIPPLSLSLVHNFQLLVTKEQVEKLLYLYHGLTPDRLDRVRFRDLLHIHFSMSDDFFMDRVFRAFDRESSGFLSKEDWVRGMSIFLKGTLDEKIKCKCSPIRI